MFYKHIFSILWLSISNISGFCFISPNHVSVIGQLMIWVTGLENRFYRILIGEMVKSIMMCPILFFFHGSV